MSNSQLVVAMPRFPFYLNAFRVFSELDKSFLRDYPNVGLHSIGKFPKINLWRTVGNQTKPEEYILDAAVAGYGMDDIDIEVNHKDRTLKISKKKPKPLTDEEYEKLDAKIEANNGIDLNYDVLVHEIKESDFERIITMPDDADLEKLTCEYKNGLLSIIVPVFEESKYITKVKIDQRI